MFEFQPNTACIEYYLRYQRANNLLLSSEAHNLFERARSAALIEKLKNLILRRSNVLYDLEMVAFHQTRYQSYVGRRTVRLDKINGTLGRSNDFDLCFNPIDNRIRDRWISIAIARRQNLPLEPVELIQVGDHYFVKDGHHRISVAHALGEAFIEAAITRWDVAGCLPWENTPNICPAPQVS
jgi:hypothetical protein